MSADNIVFYFSIFVGFCVLLWAFLMIRAYDNTGKDK